MGKTRFLWSECLFLFCKNHVSREYLFLFFFFLFFTLDDNLRFILSTIQSFTLGVILLMKYVREKLCQGRPAFTKLQYPTGEVVEICVSPFQVPEMQGGLLTRPHAK